ncbi:MAG: DUF2064 domain-containing protein [Deltaproteobacteria bacterium]|nr:MAG: DUF2064 domain-containing protein [Deltaproteobacteria bacterium]
MTGRVFVFAKAPVLGAVKTRLAASVGKARALALYRAMLEDVARVARAVDPGAVLALAGMDGPLPRTLFGLRVVRQVGPDLGARIASAVAGRARGAVAVVGSDHPCIRAEDLRACLHLARPGHLCLAPTDDGGYWCLAAAGGTDLRPVLSDIPWSTDRVFAATRDAARRAGLRVEVGPPGFDIDDGGDLDRARGLLAAQPERAPRLARLLGIE